MKPIPIEAAKKVAKAYGYDQVIIVARKVGGGEHVTTYGVDEVHCSIAARIGNFLKHKVMGWPIEAGAENEELARLDKLVGTLSTTLQKVKKERDAYKERLQIDPSGSDVIDQLTDACAQLRHRIECLENGGEGGYPLH